MLAVDGDPRVSVGAANDLVRDERHVLFADRIVERPPDQPLDGEDGALGIGHRLPLSGLAHQTFAIVSERDNGRRGARALGILDHLGRRALHDSDARIGCAKVDANYFRHYLTPVPSRDRRAPKRQGLRKGFHRSLCSRRLTPSGPHLSTPNLVNSAWFSSPNQPVGAYIGGAFWPRKARKRRILHALRSSFQSAPSRAPSLGTPSPFSRAPLHFAND